MIHCDTDAERQAMVDLVWAVKDVLLMKHNKARPMEDLSHAFDGLFTAIKGEDLIAGITVD